jgi:hypothetical protein
VPLCGTTPHMSIINRQNYAVREYGTIMREAINMHYVNGKEPLMKDMRDKFMESFMVNEQNLVSPEATQERHEKAPIAGSHVAAYLEDTGKDGPFNEEIGQMELLKLKMVENRAPMPPRLKRDLLRVQAMADAHDKEKKKRAAQEN